MPALQQHYTKENVCYIAGSIHNVVSPNTARWQQQINSSFEALVSGALSPHLADSHQLADCSDWRYTVDDLRGGVCPTVDNLRLKDWSLRHLEQRSDSRDSGLESDAAADRHHVCPVKKPQVGCCAESRCSLLATFGLQNNEPFSTNLLEMDAVAQSNSPSQLHSLTDAGNYHLCGDPGKTKLQTVRQCGRVSELTNGFVSYPHTQDSSRPIVFQCCSSVSSLHDISRLHSSQSNCLTRW